MVWIFGSQQAASLLWIVLATSSSSRGSLWGRVIHSDALGFTYTDGNNRFMIGGLSVALPMGRLYGIFDAKWLYVISTLIFMGGSALCGGAPNMAALIVGRVIAGAGGNGMYVGVVTLLSVNTSDTERPTYLGLV